MTVTGTLSGNTIQLDEPAPLPDGIRVELDLRALPRDRPLTREERMELVHRTEGSMRATPEQIRAVLDEDDYGVE
jgi:hypothetical protein